MIRLVDICGMQFVHLMCEKSLIMTHYIVYTYIKSTFLWGYQKSRVLWMRSNMLML
jgi:hypothetical protein